jgi:hypothetical protein
MYGLLALKGVLMIISVLVSIKEIVAKNSIFLGRSRMFALDGALHPET